MPAIVTDATDKNAEKNAEKKSLGKKKSGVDKWKKKTWYTVIAPKEFDRKELGTTVAEKPQLVVGRTMNSNARTLSGDIKKSHITLIFRITDIKGDKAHTVAAGHEVKDSYLRKFVRRRNSKVEVVRFVETKDNVKAKVKAMVLTGHKMEQGKRTALRKIMADKIAEIAKTLDSQTLVSELVFGTIPQKIFGDAKKIGSVKRVEITKSWLFKK